MKYKITGYKTKKTTNTDLIDISLGIFEFVLAIFKTLYIV